MKDVRMGGPFHDFELTAEYFAMSAPIIFFLAVRAQRLLTRLLFVFLLVADIALLFSTVTRGAFISLAIGVLYMGYTCRRDLNIVRVMTIGGAFVALVLIVDTLVARYTISGSLFGRMLQTTFESGIVPDTRAIAWGGAITRGFEHPFIGHGPGWDFGKALETELWPHNAYLYYFNITGFFGLAAFLFLLVRLFKASLAGYRNSLVNAPFPLAFMKVLHVSLVIFIVDQMKIDYLRNNIYMFTVWIFFGMIAATRNVIRSEFTARNGT
jgi:O-antigen ligase